MRVGALAAPIAIALVVAVAHAPALSGPWHFDDHLTVAVDPGARDVRAWADNVGRHVRPLAKLSFALAASPDLPPERLARRHRLVSLGLHLLVVLLAWRLGIRVLQGISPALDAGTARRAAALAAFVFALHPLATEAVSYLAARSMLLGTLFAFAATLAWIEGRTGGSRPWLAAAFATAIAAVLARETMAVIPLAWLLWEWARADRDETSAFSLRRLATIGGLVAFAGTFAALALVWLSLHPRYGWLLETSLQLASAGWAAPSLAPALRYFAEGLLLLRYPAIDPDPAFWGLLSPASRFATTAIALALGVLAWRTRQTRPWRLFAWGWIALWLVPLYLVPVRHDALAERHFYPALWAAALVFAAEVATRRSRMASWTVAAAVAALALVTAVRSADYRSEVALWEAARRSAPQKVRVLNNLGVAYLEARRWHEARAVLREAQALAPDDEAVKANLYEAELLAVSPSPRDSAAPQTQPW